MWIQLVGSLLALSNLGITLLLPWFLLAGIAFFVRGALRG